MPHLTTLDERKQHIALLAGVDESDTPFISAYLSLENGRAGWRETLDELARTLRRVLEVNPGAVTTQAWSSRPELRSQNLAVAGSAATPDALRWGEVDTLVMASDYHPIPAGPAPPVGLSAPRCRKHRYAHSVRNPPSGRWM